MHGEANAEGEIECERDDGSWTCTVPHTGSSPFGDGEATYSDLDRVFFNVPAETALLDDEVAVYVDEAECGVEETGDEQWLTCTDYAHV